jgi:uncharacterized short protein YbdD (DUF466 family)
MNENQSAIRKLTTGDRMSAIGASVGEHLAAAARNVWLGVREWCGDSAYERYLQAQRTTPEGAAVLTREQFYVEQLNRRYSRPNRCC